MNSRLVRGVKIAVIGILAIGIFGFVVMSLWNWLVPALFGWHTITFWQALGVLVLSRILFGGFHGGRGRGHWRGRMRARWEQMTPEERERFRQGMFERCGRSAEPGAAKG
ncbi:MAG TPA: hypothetical protein VML19_24285 [Verrucomicrobiae bacterium]|nr:hypothetical protein [Verrucomicrobiae bacterium]